MSDRAEQKPPGTTRDHSNAASPTASPPRNHNTQPTISGFRRVTSPVAPVQARPTGRFELPPLNRPSNEILPPPTGRIAGVSSILNPSQPEDSIQGRRRKASQLESPTPPVHSLPSITAATQSVPLQPPPPPSSFSSLSPSLQYGAAPERPPRRILTPRSPSLHRAASLGQLNQSTGTISAQQNLFPNSPHSRVYTVDPGTYGAPPLPTPPPIQRTGYGYPVTNPPEGVRGASGGTSRTRALSSSASPTTSYSSYSQMEQTSPATQYVATSLAPFPDSHSASGEPSMGLYPSAHTSMNVYGSERQRPMGIPISSSGSQNVYQMMTLETTAGTVQLPVDVQAASRVADEKRRRNAGASARFRQRRKEKEKEASTTISKLEQQVKELGEDADFYRRERDIFQGILSTIPGCERHLQRPRSPRLRKPSIPSLAGHGGNAYGGSEPALEHVQRSPDGRNVRRRTSTFDLPPPPPPPPAQHHIPAPGASYHPSYGPPVYGAPLAPQSGPAPQPGRSEEPTPSIGRGLIQQTQQMTHGHPQSLPPPPVVQQQPQGPPQVLQPTPQTGPWNSYPNDRRPPGPQGRSRDGR